jgi:hypothetical protein
LEKVGKIRKLIEMASEPPAEIIHGMLTDFLFSADKFEDKVRKNNLLNYFTLK